MFLEYDQLVKHNSEVNQDKETIWFTRCPRECKTQYQDIMFISRTRRLQPMEDMDKKHQEIGKEPDFTNPEDLPEYIQLFTYLFNKKKFEKLLEQREQDHKINLLKDTPKELNAKAYAMMVKEDKSLNQ